MKKLLALVLVLAFVAGTLWAGGGRAAVGRTDMNTLTIASAAFPPNLDPTLTNDMTSAQLHHIIYDTLVNYDFDMSIVPGLAYRWSMDDPSRISMFLRQGVRFHNGDVFTASVVVFSLQRAAVSPHIGHITGMIQNVQAINPHEVLITLQYPFAPFLSHLAHTATSIVNQRAVTTLGEDAHALAPVGTGAYRVTGLVTGDRVEMTRFDDFWDTPARVQNLTWRSIPDGATRLLELETGGIDIKIGLHTMPHDISRTEAHPNVRVYRQMSLSTNYVGFNTQRAPFNDVRVRQAVHHALDLDAINRVINPGVGATATGPINSMVWGSIAGELPRIEFNQARARQLLAEAGFPNGFNTTIYTNEGNAVRADLAEIMQHQLAAVGINVDISIIEWGAYLDLTARGEHNMFILGWVSVTGDPDYGLHPLFHTSNFGAAGNRTFWGNTHLDNLLDAGRAETDPARRLQIYAEVQQIVQREVPWVFWHVGEWVHAARTDVRGFRTHPADYIRAWEIYFD